MVEQFIILMRKDFASIEQMAQPAFGMKQATAIGILMVLHIVTTDLRLITSLNRIGCYTGGSVNEPRQTSYMV